MKTSFAKETFAAWFDFNYPLLYTFIEKTDLEAPVGRGCSIQLSMPAHTVAISAWDQGNKLEIIVIDENTGKAKVDDKAFSSREQLLARLDAFLVQFESMKQ